MKIITSIVEMQSIADRFRREGKTIGFVPTMGYLHEGHLSLVHAARGSTEIVVMSIFVNPTQFGPTEDYGRYPRDIDHDSRLAKDAGTDILFIPQKQDIYPEDYDTYISIERMTQVLEGKFRPTHFRGVTTIVGKLFLIVKPHKAFFGQKDAQQYLVIRKMTADLNFDIDIVVIPTVREADGLAKSSRNIYLSPAERQQAPLIYRSLQLAETAIRHGERNAELLKEQIRSAVVMVPGIVIDYISAVETKTLTEISVLEPGSSVLLVVAVRIGTTRLIDNIPVIIK
jgi:pantoate--beta-alanine ligase